MVNPTREQPVPAQRGTRPEEPESPLDLTAPDWKAALKRTFKEAKANRISFCAAALAYYWFLALFPALIALVGTVGLLRLPTRTIDSLVSGVQSTLPSGAAEVLGTALQNAGQQAGRSIAAIIGIAIAVWAASSGMVALQTGLNLVYDVPEDRKFIKARFVALILMVSFVVFGGGASALLVFGESLGEFLQDYVPIDATVFLWLWTAIRWILTVAFISLLFSLVFYLGPKRPSPKWQWVSSGGILGTLIWLAASVVFSLYVTQFGSYGKTYGALAGVVILILWLYVTGIAVLFGGELNAELERQSELRAQQL